ncbi:MAG: diguanylate cyclase, partial [Gorillibacterium sp.]|nr:diguanylate cyclase [Gorillibacterium sp.]
MTEVHWLNYKRYMIIFILLLSVQFLMPYVARSEELPDKKILILNSYHKGLAWTDDQTKGMEETLQSAGIQATLYTEYMDWKRSPTEENISITHHVIQSNYANKKIDLIITTDDAALKFALQYRAELLGNAPIVFSGVNLDGVRKLVGTEPNITGVIEEVNPAGTIRLALHINPALKTVYVLFDHTESGRSTGKLVMDKLNAAYPGLSIEPLDQLSYDEIKNKAATLPADSILLMTTYHSDKNGYLIETDKFTSELSKASTVPIYHLYEVGLDHGAFGGSMVSGKLQGVNAAQLAMKILGGMSPRDLSLVEDNTLRNVFDYNQLEHFHIPLSKLPKGSEVINKPFSFYETYKALVLLVAGSFVLLIIFISILLYYNRQIQKIKQNLAQMNERFELATSGSGA